MDTKFMDNIRVVRETILAVGKKSFFLALPFLGSISLLTKTKLKKFEFEKIEFPKILLLVPFISFSVDSAMILQ